MLILFHHLFCKMGHLQITLYESFCGKANRIHYNFLIYCYPFSLAYIGNCISILVLITTLMDYLFMFLEYKLIIYQKSSIISLMILTRYALYFFERLLILKTISSIFSRQLILLFSRILYQSCIAFLAIFVYFCRLNCLKTSKDQKLLLYYRKLIKAVIKSAFFNLCF